MEQNQDIKNKITINDIMTNRKYRARAILVFYGILFVFLISYARTGNSNKEENKAKDNDTNKIIEKKDEIFNGFELIASKNFEFVYTFTVNENEMVSIGKKYNNKETFKTVVNKKEEIDYFADGSYARAKDKVSNSYTTISKPFVILDYFNVDLINEILNKSEKLSNIELTITNKELCSLISCTATNEEDINKIELELKNNNIVGIKIDCLAFLLSMNLKELDDGKIENANIVLEYNSFNLVENFELNWE